MSSKEALDGRVSMPATGSSRGPAVGAARAGLVDGSTVASWQPTRGAPTTGLPSREAGEGSMRGTSLRAPVWFPWLQPAQDSPTLLPAMLRGVAGLAIGGLLVALNQPRVGLLVCALSLAVVLGCVASPRAQARLDAWFRRAGLWLGKGVSWLVLVPAFLVVFTLARGWIRLTGANPLEFGVRDAPTYWLAADDPRRKLRYASSMFASERVIRRGPSPAVWVTVVAVLLLSAEGALRLWGFGSPVLYVPDAQVGFYPAPNQRTDRYAGRIEINAFGMRGPPYRPEKPAGTFRVFMIGDSTLYGGSYVDQQQLYSRLLERQLSQAAGGRLVEVLAIGVNAWGPFHEIGYLEKFGTFDADLAVVCLPTEDLYRPHYGLEKVPFHSVRHPPFLAWEELLAHLAWRLRETQIGPPSAEERAYRAAQGLGAYARLAGLLAERGAEVSFQVLPSRQAGAGDAAPEVEARDVARLRATLQSASATEVAFPLGLFRGAQGRIYHDGSHLDIDGHRLYATYLRDEVIAKSRRWKHWVGVVSAPPRNGPRT